MALHNSETWTVLYYNVALCSSGQVTGSVIYLCAELARKYSSFHGRQILLLGVVTGQVEVGHRRPLCWPTQQ